MARQSDYEDLIEVVNRIPRGCVASYGTVGKLLSRPTSGRIVGQWMSHMPPATDIAWWRVLNAKGEFSIAARDPSLAGEQKRRLLSEGVEVGPDDRVPARYFLAAADFP